MDETKLFCILHVKSELNQELLFLHTHWSLFFHTHCLLSRAYRYLHNNCFVRSSQCCKHKKVRIFDGFIIIHVSNGIDTFCDKAKKQNSIIHRPNLSQIKIKILHISYGIGNSFLCEFCVVRVCVSVGILGSNLILISYRSFLTIIHTFLVFERIFFFFLSTHVFVLFLGSL